MFDGIDTFASIELCGQFVANVDNQFRQWYFDVTDVVKSCKHDPELSLNFGSASKIVKEIARHGDRTSCHLFKLLSELLNRAL